MLSERRTEEKELVEETREKVETEGGESEQLANSSRAKQNDSTQNQEHE